MYDNEFFVVDMASCSSTGEIINSLSLALETLNHSGKKIVLKLNDSYFNQSQMLSIQSLITSYGCTLDTVETINEQTIRVAENMNILVQKPIEKRVEEKYSKEKEGTFEQFTLNKTASDKIALKEVNGLHFEADLDAIQEQQEKINIAKDLRSAGINPVGDFNEIENQIASKYNAKEEFSKSLEQYPINSAALISKQAQEIKNELREELKSQFEEEILDMPAQDNFEEKYAQEREKSFANENVQDFTQNQIQNETIKNDFQEQIKTKETEENPQDFENANKKSIGVYKKAYDENAIEKDEWEEVDFYETTNNKNQVIITDSKQTTYVNQTLRSGQILEAEGNVVIIGDCHPGSEIRAVGDITVWGILSGIAHAGTKGNSEAKIRALKMNAVQLRINDCYSRRPDSTNIPYIIKSSIFTPEEARIVDNEIMLFKINQN